MQTELTTRGRKPLPRILGGCTLLIVAAVLCVMGAIAVNAAYWTYQVHQGGIGPAQNSVVTETLTTEELMAVVATLPTGDAVAGEAVFNSAAACQACHSLEPDKQVVGPSLAGIGSAAATRRPDYTAEMYLYESITHPNAYVREGFQENTMPGNFQERLSTQQLADLVAFLLEQ